MLSPAEKSFALPGRELGFESPQMGDAPNIYDDLLRRAVVFKKPVLSDLRREASHALLCKVLAEGDDEAGGSGCAHAWMLRRSP